MLKCLDSYNTSFDSFASMYSFHEQQESESRWTRCKVNELAVEPLSKDSPLFADLSQFAPTVGEEAVKDTATNLGLALKVEGEIYPIRETAYKTLLDRAKINGTALPKLSREKLADFLTSCMRLFAGEALVLIRDEKISAVHSGDETDYSILPIDQLLEILQAKLNARFPGNVFTSGYMDHAISSAAWSMPAQKDDLLGVYTKSLEAHGQAKLANRIMPGIRFTTSDTGIASAKVSALLLGGPTPIHIGSCLAVDHRNQKKVGDFDDILNELFAQFGNSVKQLQKLLDIQLEYPINAMTRICKRLSMPKKAAVEAIKMFEMAYGGGSATAHDVYLAMQEIMFTLKSEKVPESKLLAVEENLARALTVKWSDYDLATGVTY